MDQIELSFQKYQKKQKIVDMGAMSQNYKFDLKLFLSSEKCYKVDEIDIDGQKLTNHIVIQSGLDEICCLKLFVVKEIFQNDKNKKFLVVESLDDLGYDNHFDSHLVSLTNNFILISYMKMLVIGCGLVHFTNPSMAIFMSI